MLVLSDAIACMDYSTTNIWLQSSFNKQTGFWGLPSLSATLREEYHNPFATGSLFDQSWANRSSGCAALTLVLLMQAVQFLF